MMEIGYEKYYDFDSEPQYLFCDSIGQDNDPLFVAQNDG